MEFPVQKTGRSLGAYVKAFNTRLKWSFRANKRGFRVTAVGMGRFYHRQLLVSGATPHDRFVEKYWECIDGIVLEHAEALSPKVAFRSIPERREFDRLMGRVSSKTRVVASGDTLDDLGN